MPSPYGNPSSEDYKLPRRYAVRAMFATNVASLAACTTTCDTSVTLVEGDFVLLVGQTLSANNGIYRVGVVTSGTAPLTRADHANSSNCYFPGVEFYISEGTAYGNTVYYLTNAAPVVLGTTSLTFGALTGAPATTSLATRISNAESSQASINVLVSNANSSAGSIMLVANSGTASVTSINTRVSNTNSSVDSLNTLVSNNTTSITSINTRVSNTNSSTGSLNTRVASICTYLSIA